MSETIVGIDLGTTNSEIVVIKEGKPVLLSLDGSRIVPSVVSIDAQGQIFVGIPAINNELAAPLDTIRKIKRKMGQQELISLQDKLYSPPMISSLILKRLKMAAEEFCGHPVQKAIITVPAFFNEQQREATKEAAELAGLETVRLLNEPTAAALAYSVGSPHEGCSLIYDLGGGTFDVSIVNTSQQYMEVKASHGDVELGGGDFDQMIAEKARSSFQGLHGIDLFNDPLAWTRLMRAAEKAKIRLSTEASAQIIEEFIASKNSTPIHLQFTLTRTEFESMIRPSIERSLISVRTALKMASMSPKDIQRVILVGGATCTPLVSQMLEEELQITPQAWIDPSTVVAIGAGIEAAQLSGQPLGPRLIDITPHSLGIECLDDFSTPRNYILIRRNTPLPCSNSRIFYKHFSGQEAIKISVYQGESQDPLKNQLLGKFTLDDLADSLGSDIHVKFHLDRSGLLEVAAVDISSGKQASRVLKRASNTRVKLTNLAELESVHIFTEEAEENDAEVLEIQEVKPEPASNPEEERQKLFQDAEALLNANSLEAADLEELSSVLAAAKEGDSAAIDRLSNLIYYLI